METETTHLIPRDDDVDLKFTGTLIGFGTSETWDRERWFELRIYKTNTDKYVAHGVGVSIIEGEDDRHWAYVCENADDVVDVLYREDKNGNRFLTKTALIALDEAAESDQKIADAMIEEV